jgi:hypothetical protein
MQEKPVSANATAPEKEISLRELFITIRSEFNYLISKALLIGAVGLLCALAGLAYAYFKKPVYTAASTFVLQEGGSGGGLSQYAGLASLAGIDIGGNGAGGIFEGDNILMLYKSRLMIEKTLLSWVTIDGKKQQLIDRYIASNDLLEKWKEKDGISSISFSGDPKKFTRKQDSLITDIADDFNKELLNVAKPDKKLTIIKVEVTSKDELFSKAFNTTLVETVNNFYTQTKTKKSAQNVAVLQRQADSVKNVLGYAISGVASAIDAAPNANPALSSLRVPSQKRQIDVQASSAIYGEIVKNLEISKISLRQETPLIQVIDEPVLPLTKTKVGKIKAIILGGLLGIFLMSAGIVFKRIINRIMA